MKTDPAPDHREAKSTIPPLVARERPEEYFLWAGAALFLVSFALPMAVGAGLRGTAPDEVFRGWRWAVYLFAASLGGEWDTGFLSLAIRLIGFLVALITPLTVVYAILRLRRKGPDVQQRIAIAVLVFMALTWIFLAVSWIGPATGRMRIELGYVCWIVGLVLMMGHDAIRFFTSPVMGPPRVIRPGTPPPTGARARGRWHPRF